MNNNARKQYFHNIAWSTIEAVLFQTLLLGHHSLLFKVTDSYFYGLMGTLFGFIYCAVKLFDLGFNKALLSFYSHYSTDRTLFFHFLRQQLLPNIIFYCVSIIALLCIKLFFPTHIPLLSSFDFPLLIVAAGLVATESIKALLKRLLQLAHNFRSVALGEIGCIICYQVIIWSYYLAGNQLTHIFIFGTFLVISLCETVGLFFNLFLLQKITNRICRTPIAKNAYRQK